MPELQECTNSSSIHAVGKVCSEPATKCPPVKGTTEAESIASISATCSGLGTWVVDDPCPLQPGEGNYSGQGSQETPRKTAPKVTPCLKHCVCHSVLAVAAASNCRCGFKDMAGINMRGLRV